MAFDRCLIKDYLLTYLKERKDKAREGERGERKQNRKKQEDEKRKCAEEFQLF